MKSSVCFSVIISPCLVMADNRDSSQPTMNCHLQLMKTLNCCCCWLLYSPGRDCTENFMSFIALSLFAAVEMCLQCRCLAMIASTHSITLAFSHHDTLLPPEGCLQQAAHRRITLSSSWRGHACDIRSAITFLIGTSVSCWSKCFCFRSQQCTVFIPCVSGLALMLSNSFSLWLPVLKLWSFHVCTFLNMFLQLAVSSHCYRHHLCLRIYVIQNYIITAGEGYSINIWRTIMWDSPHRFEDKNMCICKKRAKKYFKTF